MSNEQILTNPQALKQVLLYLYQFQTPIEQQADVTVELNGKGFNHVDAEILSSFAKQVLKGYELTPKQYNILKLRLPKYHSQFENGAWQHINLAELVPTIRAAKPQSAGTLLLEQFPGGDYGLMFHPNVYPSKQIKNIGFTHWSDGKWHQAAPSVNQTTVNDVLKMFGDTVVIDPSVTEHLKPTDINLPTWLEQHPSLFPYQIETIKFQLQAKHALVALAPRLGKTVTTIFATQAADCKKVLVVAPLSLLKDWQNKILKWCGEKAAIVYKQQLLVPNRYTITNYDTVRLHPGTFLEEPWDAIIIDESLLIKHRKTARIESIRRLVQDAKPKYLWLLSGAPTSKLYNDMWAQLNVLDPKRFSSYWRFVERYCEIEASPWSKYNIVANKPDAAEMIHKDLADMFIHFRQEDVLDLPPWQIDNLEIPMSKGQDKMYAGMEEAFLAELSDDEHLMAPNVLSQMLRLVQLASNPLLVGGKDESPKWDAVLELLKFEQAPAIVWTNFIETANQLLERLQLAGFTAAKLTGATRQEDRDQIVQDFQNGRLDVLIAHPKVGKFGLDLYKAQTVIYLERSYDADDYYQSLNRVRHIEAKASPHIIQLLSTRYGEEGGSTVDHIIDKILAGRREDTLKLTSHNIRNLFETKE